MDKNTIKENAKKTIDDIFNKIQELETKKDELSVEVKAEYEQKIADLKLKKDELKANLDELEKNAEVKLEEVKATFDSAAASVKEGFSKITDLFK